MGRARRRLTVFGFLALAFCSSALIDVRGGAQGTASGIVAGRVVDGKTGEPVAGATVFVATSEARVMQRTGPSGEFAFTFDKPVRVRLTAEKSGYLRAYAGQLGPLDSGGQDATLDAPVGGRITGVILKLWQPAAVTGRIHRGAEPVTGATVAVLKREYRGAGFTWGRVPLKSGRSDDRGLYRIASLAPGQYLVAVLRDGQSNSVEPSPMFSPGVRFAATANVFTLTAGAEATDANVELDTRESAGSIAGRVLGGDLGIADVTVRLRRVNFGDERTTDLDEIRAVTDGSGSFRFADVPIGAYKLGVVLFPKSEQTLLYLDGNFHGYAFGRGRMDNTDVPLTGPVPRLPTEPTLYAERDVTVDSTASESIVLRLQPAAAISGRVLFQDGAPPEAQALPSVPMLIRPADGSDLGGIPQARIESDGTFRSAGLPPGNYVVVPLLARAQLSQSWNTVALTSGGLDLLGGAIKLDAADVNDVLLTLSTKSAEVTGNVRGSGITAPAPSTRVIIFPKSERLRNFYFAFPSPKRVIQASVSASGSFRATLPPGEYLAAAVADELPEFWMTPDYLTRLSPLATAIRLAPGDKVRVSLEAHVVPLPR